MNSALASYLSKFPEANTLEQMQAYVFMRAVRPIEHSNFVAKRSGIQTKPAHGTATNHMAPISYLATKSPADST